MESTPFDSSKDIPTIPFTRSIKEAALEIKESGLNWHPHVGCFVWDREDIIDVSSPFPENIYFILNMGHFLRIFGTVDEIKAKLVWLPSWTQALAVYKELGGETSEIKSRMADQELDPEGLILALYRMIVERLNGEAS